MTNFKKIGLLAHPEVSLSRIVSSQKAVFKAFFFRKSLFWPISVQWCPLSVIHGWKAEDLIFLMVKRKKILILQCVGFSRMLCTDISFILRNCRTWAAATLLLMRWCCWGADVADASDALMLLMYWCYWTKIRTCSRSFLKQFALVFVFFREKKSLLTLFCSRDIGRNWRF